MFSSHDRLKLIRVLSESAKVVVQTAVVSPLNPTQDVLKIAPVKAKFTSLKYICTGEAPPTAHVKVPWQ